tara:strand:- start:247 stop:414 length:168 start_codon:yes stop_codon:yes gene_type:complete
LKHSPPDSALTEKSTFGLLWKNGDLALMDNHTVMHVRLTFTGTRKVLASFVAEAA